MPILNWFWSWRANKNVEKWFKNISKYIHTIYIYVYFSISNTTKFEISTYKLISCWWYLFASLLFTFYFHPTPTLLLSGPSVDYKLFWCYWKWRVLDSTRWSVGVIENAGNECIQTIEIEPKMQLSSAIHPILSEWMVAKVFVSTSPNDRFG